MSARPIINSLRFAREGGELEGVVPVAELTRLADLLVVAQGEASYRLTGGVHAGRPELRLRVAVDLVLLCQRCLTAYVQPVRLDSRMPVARNEAELARWESDDPLLDALVADERLDVRELLEDELLLGLPVVPKHPEGGCGVVAE